MKYIPRILVVLGWNKRPLTFEDFEEACKHQEVEILWLHMPTRGMYFVCKGRPFIALSTRLFGIELWRTAWHEFGHYLLHQPALRYFSRGTLSKAEAEAEAISLCAVLDEPTLRRIIAHGELHDYPTKLINQRLRLLGRRNI